MDIRLKRLKIMLTIKQIFQYQVIRESYIFFFTNEREQMKNKSKNNEFVSIFFFVTKRKHVKV